ncbi:MAG: hypothetical protein HDT22_05585 [Ruminococcus sp.]|nr:hypothetical protein [Ruminococcus sp.]
MKSKKTIIGVGLIALLLLSRCGANSSKSKENSDAIIETEISSEQVVDSVDKPEITKLTADELALKFKQDDSQAKKDCENITYEITGTLGYQLYHTLQLLTDVSYNDYYEFQINFDFDEKLDDILPKDIKEGDMITVQGTFKRYMLGTIYLENPVYISYEPVEEPETESETVKETEPETTKATEHKTTETTEAVIETIPHRENAIGVSDKDIESLNPVFYDKVENDVTGDWKCLVVDANGSMPEYVLSAYNKYGKKAKVFVIEDTTGKQAIKASISENVLNIEIHQYVNQEEQDAKLMLSGDLLAEYWIYTDNGDVMDKNPFAPKEIITEPITESKTEPPTSPPTQPQTEPPVQANEPKTLQFILNLETNCVHINANCSAAQQISPENYAVIELWDNELGNYAYTYWACGKCSKTYSSELPKF